MNKEIKFRGKDAESGIWLYGDLLKCDGKTYISQHSEVGQERNKQDDVCIHEVISETVGQYTGLRDCRGKEVYEGDIVSWLAGMADGTGRMETGHVEWKQDEVSYRVVNRFKTLDGRELNHSLLRLRDLTVRGNIHDIGVL